MTDDHPLVTVCVPTIGRMRWLGSALDSLKGQRYPNLQILLLDNTATAEARALIDRYAEADRRIEVIRSDQRLEMFDNFQRGVDAASGRYLAFFHDDDIYDEDFVTRHVEVLEANPSVAFTGSNCTVIDAAGNKLADRLLLRRTEVWPGWRFISEVYALGNNVFPMQTVMFRCDWLDARTFDATLGPHYSDFLILMRLAENHDVGVISAPLLQLRSHDDQASQMLAADAALRLRTRLFLQYADELAERWPARGEEVARLRGRVSAARRSAAVWMWLTAGDTQQAADARSALEGPGFDGWLSRGLGLIDRSGISQAIRSKGVRRRLRAAAYTWVGRSRH